MKTIEHGPMDIGQDKDYRINDEHGLPKHMTEYLKAGHIVPLFITRIAIMYLEGPSGVEMSHMDTTLKASHLLPLSDSRKQNKM